MAFGLGVAIANLFARVAAALGGSSVGGVGPLPPRPSPPVTPSPPRTSPPPGGVIPEPPHSPPRTTTIPPPVVVIPPTPYPEPRISPPSNCELLSLSDRIALAALEGNLLADRQVLTPYTYTPDFEDIEMPNATNSGNLVEATDVFRFRAFSTSDVVKVSFFGRVMSASGNITPFNHDLITSVAGTIYETIVPCGRGMLLGAAASVPVNSINAGSVSAVGEIGRVVTGGFVPHSLLFSGQLDDLTPLTSSSASVSAPVGVPTFVAVGMNAFVAATSTTTITPSAGKRIRICHVSADYVCSGTVGNRQLVIRLRNSGMTLHEALPDQYLTASQSGVYRASLGLAVSSASGALPGSFREISLYLPDSLYFYTATDVLVSAYGIQAGDAPAVGFIRYEET